MIFSNCITSKKHSHSSTYKLKHRISRDEQRFLCYCHIYFGQWKHNWPSNAHTFACGVRRARSGEDYGLGQHPVREKKKGGGVSEKDSVWGRAYVCSCAPQGLHVVRSDRTPGLSSPMTPTNRLQPICLYSSQHFFFRSKNTRTWGTTCAGLSKERQLRETKQTINTGMSTKWSFF